MPIPNIPPGFTVADIKAELGSTNNSLQALGGLANPPLATPFLMSEFANYTHYTSGFYRNDGVNDYAQIEGGASSNAIGSSALTISFWVRNNASVHQNIQIVNIAPGFSSGDRLMIDYNMTNNQLRFNHRQGSSNNIRGYYMNNNSSKTGLSGAWTSTNRGTTNSNGWNMLTYVYDGKQSGLNGLTVWWNNQQLDYQANATAGARANLSMTNIRFGENIHNVGSAGNATMDFDEFKMYSRLLSYNDINALYQAGTTNPASAGAAGVTANLISEIRFDGGMIDLQGHFTGIAGAFNGGQFIAY